MRMWKSVVGELLFATLSIYIVLISVSVSFKSVSDEIEVFLISSHV